MNNNFHYSTVVMFLCYATGLSAEFVEPIRLDDIIVSATRSDYGFKSTPSLITVITQDQIQASGATNLVDVLQGLGGIQVSDLFGDGTDVSIGLRGFSATAQQNTLIMIDGRRLNNTDNGLPDLNTVAIRNIERVEIIKGSAGTLYGDKAVGGVINIITRSAGQLNMQVAAELGSFNHRSLFLNIENRHDNGIGYRLSGERRLSDNYRDDNALQLTDVAGKIDFLHARGNIFFEYQAINEDIETPGSLFRDLLLANRKNSLNAGDFLDTDTRVNRIGLKQIFNHYVEGQVEYTNRQSETSGRLSSGGVASPLFLKRHHIEFTPRLVGKYRFSTGQSLLTIGSDFFKTDYLLISDFGLTENTQTQLSVYLQGIIPLSQKLDLTLGGRYSEVDNDILVDTLAFGRSLPPGSEIDDTASAYEAGLTYTFDSHWRIFGKIDKNFRFVTADEYSAVADNNFFANLFLFGKTVPFPETQTGISYELGTEWSQHNRGVKVLIYQLDLDDEIVFNPAFFLNTNIGDSRRRGFIFEGYYAPADKLKFTANYGYIDAELISGNFKGSEITFIADHTARLTAQYKYNEKFSGYFEINGVSERLFEGDFANAFSSLPGYVVSNLNLTYKHNNFVAAFKINNLFDKEYSDAGQIGFDFRQPFPAPQVETFFPAPERNYLLSLSYNYD